ncbi:MAG TPA: ribonuclease domain-containing protein [Vicinamibacteria bacterium]|nr:ribonuclease domain-containing protein [Vicinamibacteria bacterium]
MKPARSGPRRLVLVLIVLAGVVLGRSRGADTRATAPVAPPAPAAARSGATADSATPATLDLRAVDSAEHRAQIERVVEAMDLTGEPPAGVAQGGRRGGPKGVFQNAEGRLPRRRLGYWVESDVWPKNGPRDAERLIFGREREVYWTRDHYETFVRLR